MIITKIEKQKNNNKRYSIFIDNEFAFGIDEIDLLYYKLKENEVLDQEKYKYINNKLLLKRAKDTALKYLSFKMRSKKQVIDKLEDNGYPSIIIDKVIALLEKYKYIDDESFAKAFIKDKSSIKGYGLYKIKYELKMLGIDEYIYEKYIIDKDILDEEKEAKRLLSKKAKNLDLENIDYKQKQKLYAYLARRGFSYEIINKVFAKLLEEEL